MIDTNCECLISVPTGVSKIVPGRPHASTIWRWHRRGVKGVRLETVLIGGRRYTSREALARFSERVTAAADGTGAAPSTPKARARALAQAERDLDAAGI